MRCTKLCQCVALRARVYAAASYPAVGSPFTFSKNNEKAITRSAMTVMSRAAATTGATDTNAAPHVVHYSKLGMDGFTDVKFNMAADELLQLIETYVDAVDSAAVEDVSCNGGVLTIETTERGTFILNKQAPNVQLWLSSPISGPHHYDMITMTQGGREKTSWKSDHDGHDLVEKLERELTEVLGTNLKLEGGQGL
ncbi:hypothetical protein JKF63_04606 [Porcisia hertigi]|uniref:ferroxidase n=1 Tax=Porcisia hertigi TaxID=2761500 RepID=A0A836LAE9_9TRYP|nr:hypothetical protein JKF63_04606 [Porcisia hertigi]